MEREKVCEQALMWSLILQASTDERVTSRQQRIFSWSGDSLPAAPTFFSIARREILVKWQPPETIHGRLNRYQLVCNGKTIYSGTDQECRATELKPDKEYSMHVIVFTSEGQFRSRTTKARTLKDECSYNAKKAECSMFVLIVVNGSHRNSLYETPPPNPVQLKRAKTVHVAQMSGTSHNIPKAPSRPVKAAREGKHIPKRWWEFRDGRFWFPSSGLTAES